MAGMARYNLPVPPTYGREIVSKRLPDVVKVISGQDLAGLDRAAREKDVAAFRADPSVKMPVFVGRNNPRLQVRWAAKQS